MKSYFLIPNNTKYLVLLKTLINSSCLLKLTHKGLAAIKFLYEMLQTKMISYEFPSNNMLSRPKSSILIMSSK